MSSASADRPRRDVRAAFDAARFDYQYIDIDEDSASRTMVREINGGFESTPVVILPDGRFYSEPSEDQVGALLGPESPAPPLPSASPANTTAAPPARTRTRSPGR